MPSSRRDGRTPVARVLREALIIKHYNNANAAQRSVIYIQSITAVSLCETIWLGASTGGVRGVAQRDVTHGEEGPRVTWGPQLEPADTFNMQIGAAQSPWRVTYTGVLFIPVALLTIHCVDYNVFVAGNLSASF